MKMKAWRVEKHGGAEALKYVDIDAPVAGPMQVRVRVEAVGLNHLDLWVRNGVPGHVFPLPLTPGCDVAGRIESFGPGAEAACGLKLDQPVLLNPGVSCGVCAACLGGFDPLCPKYGILGEHRDGGCAELVVVPVQNVIARDPLLTAEQAAALPIPFVTAYTMVTAKAAVRLGETVLVQAGGSGVSIAAIQLCKMLGATVITTVGDDAKVEKARDLGADHVINYKKTPFRDEVRKFLARQGKKGCEVVIDHVGEETFAESMRCLAWGGRLVTCGATSGADVKIDLKAVFFKNLSILGSTMGSKANLMTIQRLVAEGKLRPIIDSTYEMRDYSDALNKLQSRAIFGKVIVKA